MESKVFNLKMMAMSAAIFSLVGCAAMNTAIKHRNLDVQTKMSESIFLNPVPNAEKTVYIKVRNTSDKSISNLSNEIRTAVRLNGYSVVSDLSKAHYLLQANVLKAGKTSKAAADSLLGGGYGSSLSGGAVGALTGATVGASSGRALLGAGLVGGVISNVANDLVEDRIYTLVTDLEISERLAKGVVANTTTKANINQGSATKSVTQVSKQSKWLKYRTRVVSTAEKVNLKFVDAQPLLKKQLVHAIANIL